MKRFAIIVGLLVVAWISYCPLNNYLSLPREVRAAWVEPLATMGTRYHLQRELFTGGDDARNVFDELEPVLEANEQKRKLYAVFKSRTGNAGLLRKYSTVEGRPILAWVLVQDGEIAFVEDCSRDGGAPPWTVYKRAPLDFKLGFMRNGEFVEGEPAFNNSPIIVFQLRVHNRLENRQIDNVYFF